ncbi:hypothetical protein AAFN86_26250 [Roseomonas sp. CAU 1739]|uniref:hypothetical protein n=1 Tax=Roseomonas sp. CAU 1739 TaxID=3140364 RepID=UPI00325A6A06
MTLRRCHGVATDRLSLVKDALSRSRAEQAARMSILGISEAAATRNCKINREKTLNQPDLAQDQGQERICAHQPA